jgi:hypothetical protein
MWAAFPERILHISALSPSHLAASAPIAYVVGMSVDHAGAWMARLLGKLTIRRRGVSADRIAAESVRIMHKAEIMARSAEVGKQYELRKSRDRVARGFFANAVLAAIAGLVMIPVLNPPVRFAWSPVCMLLAAVAYAEWLRSAVATWNYGVAASRALSRMENERHDA